MIRPFIPRHDRLGRWMVAYAAFVALHIALRVVGAWMDGRL